MNKKASVKVKKGDASSASVRERLGGFCKIYENRQLQEDWEALDPRDRMRFYLEILKYVVPMLQSIQVSGDNEKPLTIEDKLKALISK